MTASVTAQPAAAAAPLAPRASPWLVSPRYDGAFFFLSGAGALALLLPYFVWGQRVVAPIFMAHVAALSLPHHYLTWASIVPPAVRRTLRMRPIAAGAAIALAICLLLPPTRGTRLNDVLLTGVALLSIWHFYRQQAGIVKVYDLVQMRRTSDAALLADQKALGVLLALGSWAMVVWIFTQPEVVYGFSDVDRFRLVYPVLPRGLFVAYLGAMAVAAAWAAKRSIVDRLRAGKRVPWPQIGLVLLALAVNNLPFALVPVEALLLVVTVASVYHIAMYFGFVWMFERRRSPEMLARTGALGLPQRLALDADWKRYFALAYVYSAAVLACSAVLPAQLGLALIYYSNVSHYIIDGLIWKRGSNPWVPAVLGRLA